MKTEFLPDDMSFLRKDDLRVRLKSKEKDELIQNQ